MKKNGFINKVKEAFTLSTLSKILTLAVIVISTLFPNFFDPENADWKKVLSSFILSLVIVLAAFISQMISRKKKEMDKETYKNSQTNHIDQIHVIQKKQLSHLHKLYVKDENEKNLIDYVKDVFMQFEIDMAYYTMKADLIKTAYKKGMIDKDQLSVIRLCRSGRVQYDKYDVRDLTTTQILKNSVNTNKSQAASITYSNLLSKMSFMLAFSIIWGMFVYDEATQSGVSGQAWLDLCSRIISFVGGLWCGDVTGREIILDEIRLYDKFYAFNSKFVQDFTLGIWKPKEELVGDNIVDTLIKLQEKDKEQVDADTENVEESTETEVVEISEEEYQKLVSEGKL